MFLLISAVSCAPKAFVKTSDPAWNVIEIQKGVTYHKAWKTVRDLTAKKFDIAEMSKKDGYIRTEWLNSITDYGEFYKFRTIIKFSPDRRIINIIAEYHPLWVWMEDDTWAPNYTIKRVKIKAKPGKEGALEGYDLSRLIKHKGLKPDYTTGETISTELQTNIIGTIGKTEK
jgi:hypothetical protein